MTTSSHNGDGSDRTSTAVQASTIAPTIEITIQDR